MKKSILSIISISLMGAHLWAGSSLEGTVPAVDSPKQSIESITPVKVPSKARQVLAGIGSAACFVGVLMVVKSFFKDDTQKGNLHNMLDGSVIEHGKSAEDGFYTGIGSTLIFMLGVKAAMYAHEKRMQRNKIIKELEHASKQELKQEIKREIKQELNQAL